METLLYFIIWAGMIFVMMRFGCGSHVMGHKHSTKRDHNQTAATCASEVLWEPPAKDRDLVCQKTVHTNTAKPSVHAGRVYYFCSRDCREAFEAAPDIYIGDAQKTLPGRDHEVTVHG